MGMYTELNFNSELKENTPQDIIDILKYMVGDLAQQPIVNDTVGLFDDTRWAVMLQTDSYYFDADTHSTLRYDDISLTYYLCIQCNLKNYNSEIEEFIIWIKPYLNKQEGDFLGHYRYEEEKPTLIYM